MLVFGQFASVVEANCLSHSFLIDGKDDGSASVDLVGFRKRFRFASKTLSQNHVVPLDERARISWQEREKNGATVFDDRVLSRDVKLNDPDDEREIGQGKADEKTRFHEG
jgi:hypothetical protein